MYGIAEQKRHGPAGARRYWLIWVAVAPVALWALVRLLGLDRGFPLVPLMAFTPYAAIAVLSANIHHGTADAEALVDRHRPALLAIQELTPSFDRELRRAGLDRRLPNAVLETRRYASGAGLYSHLPMRKLAGSQVEDLPGSDHRLVWAELVLP